MKENNYNIEELKLLIPDYITGDISIVDKQKIEEALNNSEEIARFHQEMKSAFEFISEVKQNEPEPAYWNSLIPRIHDRIEERQQSKFSWGNIASLWKILVPVSAIVLIAILYYSFSPSETEITKDDKQELQQELKSKEENITADTISKVNTEDSKQNNILPGNNIKERSIDEKSPKKFLVPDRKIFQPKLQDDNIVKDETPEKQIDPVNTNESADIVNIDPDETAVFTIGESAGLDEETEIELNKLKENEKDLLLEQLLNSNL
jgi:hypothetical protein